MKNSQRLWLVVLILVVVGFGLRMVDLTDPPADFHPTRQFRGAMIARSIYFDLMPDADPQRQVLAAQLSAGFEEFEPPVLETVVAWGYLLLGEETLWLARVIVSLVWCLGGIALFVLVNESVSGIAGLAALSYYLFLPFGAIASRAFQPDPIMTVGMVLVMLAAYKWSGTLSWKWALVTGLLGASTVLIKIVAAYLILGMMVLLVLRTLGLKKAVISGQVWLMAALMTVLPGLYYFFGIGESSTNYFQNWVVALLPFTLTKEFYIGWLKRLYAFNPFGLLAAALGTAFFARGRSRWMLWGLWIGYALYGYSLPYQTATHNYYHIQITPIVAWSLAFSFKWLLDKIGEGRQKWQFALVGLVLLGNVYAMYNVVGILGERDSHAEPQYWATVAEQIPDDGETIGLVQYYGHLLMFYGWEEVALWPVSSEIYLAELRGSTKIHDFPALFADKTEDMDYFLVTLLSQFEEQTELHDHLYAHYQLAAEGPGYLLFDLRQPISD